MVQAENTKENELSTLLVDAADEKPGAAAAFFEALLRAEVWVALSAPAKPDNPEGVKIVGKVRPEEIGLVSVNYEGNDCVPIFTQESFVNDWTLKDVYSDKRSLKSLLWIITDGTWLYVNPNQEVGKEITAWEVEQLRKGAEAIPDLVAALGDGSIPDIEVNSDASLYPELKRKILPVLELCKNLEEAFLVAVKEDGGSVEKPMLGLKYSKDVGSAEKKYIKDELQHVGAEEYSDGKGGVLVVDDLGSVQSPSRNIFSDAVPFYIGQRQASKGQGIITSVKSIFSSRKEKQDDSSDE